MYPYISKREKMKTTQEINHWNPDKYNKHTGFVSKLALPVVDLLDPKQGEKILDAGCGEGTLAVEIAKRGADVIGIDLSAEMIEQTKIKGIEAYVCSVTDIPYKEEFDALFSNATLHWVKDAKGAIQSIARSLKNGGRFVAEFGGDGNVKHIVNAIEKVFAHHPEFGVFENSWYFPTPQTYRVLLESEGFHVEYIELIPRPTPMEDVVHWLEIFANGITMHLSKEQFEIFKTECREILKEKIYRKDNVWVIDYVWLRVKAVKK